jgi:hypothetical protein
MESMRLRCFPLAALMLAVASSAPAVALEVTVEAPPELAAKAAEVRAIAAEGFAEQLELVGLREPGPPIRVVLAPDDSDLARNAPSWVSGYALGPLSTVVLFPDRVPSYPDRNLPALVRHEVTHVLTWRAAHGGELPRWFAEGLATVGAREWGMEDRARYAMAVIGRGPTSTTELDAAFLRHIQREHGADVAARILARVAGGQPFDAAFLRATGTPLASTARGFFLRDPLWNTWVPLITSSTGLWMAITLLAIWAIRRRRQRDAEARARWEAEEADLERAWVDELRRMRLESDDPMRHN